MQLKNDLLIRAAKGEKTERVPVWMMRQAGRILPEYRAVRNALSGFRELVETPERAAEVTVQPVDILGVDAAIIFSDILTIPDALGLKYEMVEKVGPRFPVTFQGKEDLKKLRKPHAETDLGYVGEAIRQTKKELDGRVPLIGFAGAPWTIFCYMIEGGGSKTFSKARGMLFQEPEVSHQLLQAITDATIDYLKMQINAGADIVQVFDSWAGVPNPPHYSAFGTEYVRKICEAITEVPVIAFAKGAHFAMNEVMNLPCNVVGLDWHLDPGVVRKYNAEMVLQGNLDPCTLYADTRTIENETLKMLRAFGGHKHIANLGHGVYPDTNPEKVKVFIETVKSYETN